MAIVLVGLRCSACRSPFCATHEALITLRPCPFCGASGWRVKTTGKTS